MKKQKELHEKSDMANIKLHEYWSDDKNRKASVHKNQQGFYVKLFFIQIITFVFIDFFPKKLMFFILEK